MTNLLSVRDQLAMSLARKQCAVVRLRSAGPDQVMSWAWLRRKLSEDFSEVQVCRLAAPAGFAYRVSCADAGDEVSLDLDFPWLTEADLIQVLYAQRSDLTRHYGLVVTRRAQVRAFECANARRPGAEMRLGSTFDLLDRAVLAYRQSLLGLARTHDDVEVLDRALSSIALAIEESSGRRPQAFDGNVSHVASLTALRSAFRDFQNVVGSLGGRERAAFIDPEAIQNYVDGSSGLSS